MTSSIAVKNYTSHHLYLRVANQQVNENSAEDETSILAADDGPSIRGAVEPYSHVRIPAPISFAVNSMRLTVADSAGSKAILSVNLSARSAHADTVRPTTGHGANLDITAFKLNNGALILTRQIDLQRWMESMPDQTQLELLSIPGTHNSAACHRALPSIRCQIISPREQLEHGVRFLDVRLQVDKPNDASSPSLSLVHSLYPVALIGSWKFGSLHKDILDFLKCNPSETVILSLKREGRGSGTDADLARKLHEHHINDKHWMTTPGIPTLGEARGKIVLIRRFGLTKKDRVLYSRTIGIDAQVWEDNSSNSHAGDVHIQDFYQVLHTDAIRRKMEFVLDHCKRANATNPSGTSWEPKSFEHTRGPLFLNFLSGSNLWVKGCWPEKIAAKVNPNIAERLCDMELVNHNRGMGILIMDWIGEDGNFDLVKMIVAMNDKLLAEVANAGEAIHAPALYANLQSLHAKAPVR